MAWKAAYPEEIRNQMLELVRAGKSPTELSRMHEPSAECIRGWVKKADRDAAKRADSLTPDERTELTQLRKENATLLAQREQLAKENATLQLARVAAQFTRESADILCQTMGIPPSRH